VSQAVPISDLQIIARMKPLTGDIPGAILTAQTTAPLNAMPCGSRSGEPRWHVLTTKHRAEYRALVEINRLGFRPYLPMFVKYSRPKKLGEQTRAEVLPLFSGYMFVAFNPFSDQWRRIFSARGVSGMFMLPGERPIPVRRGVVEAIQAKGRAGDGVIDEHAQAFSCVTAGETYRVVGGAFDAFQGICTMSDGKRAKLLLSMLGQDREVEFTKGELERVGNGAPV
jgi:transcription antitermination factor NusG